MRQVLRLAWTDFGEFHGKCFCTKAADVMFPDCEVG
jgi:hypothetical protein